MNLSTRRVEPSSVYSGNLLERRRKAFRRYVDRNDEWSVVEYIVGGNAI